MEPRVLMGRLAQAPKGDRALDRCALPGDIAYGPESPRTVHRHIGQESRPISWSLAPHNRPPTTIPVLQHEMVASCSHGPNVAMSPGADCGERPVPGSVYLRPAMAVPVNRDWSIRIPADSPDVI